MNNIFFSNENSVSSFWNPLQLVTSAINRTQSYENLTLEEKVKSLEENILNFKENYPDVNKCKEVFVERILYLINQNDSENNTFLREFYEESPDYMENGDLLNMFKTLNWLSYSDDHKKNLLDREIDNYFN